MESTATIHIDSGAASALRSGGVSLLAAGITSIDSTFERRDAVEVIDPTGEVVAKGLARIASEALDRGEGGVVVHVDDMVVLAEPPIEVI